MPHKLWRYKRLKNYGISCLVMISSNFFVCKVGSIQVILKSLERKKPRRFRRGPGTQMPTTKNIERQMFSVGDPEARRGAFKLSQPRPAKKTTPFDRRGRTYRRSYVRRLIPNNINDTEFIYKVNFDPGKGQNENYSLAKTFESKFLIISINSMHFRLYYHS